MKNEEKKYQYNMSMGIQMFCLLEPSTPLVSLNDIFIIDKSESISITLIFNKNPSHVVTRLAFNILRLTHLVAYAYNVRATFLLVTSHDEYQTPTSSCNEWIH